MYKFNKMKVTRKKEKKILKISAHFLLKIYSSNLY